MSASKSIPILVTLDQAHEAATKGVWGTSTGKDPHWKREVRVETETNGRTGIAWCGSIDQKEAEANVTAICTLHNAWPQVRNSVELLSDAAEDAVAFLERVQAVLPQLSEQDSHVRHLLLKLRAAVEYTKKVT